MPGGLEKQGEPMSSALRVGIAMQLEIVLDDWMESKKKEKEIDPLREDIRRKVHNELGVAKADEESIETRGAYEQAVQHMLRNDVIKRDKLNEIVEACREVYE